MFKKALVVSLVACFSILVAACSSDAEDACERIKDLCKSDSILGAAFAAADCSKAEDDAKYEKSIDCVNDAKDCSAATKCFQ